MTDAETPKVGALGPERAPWPRVDRERQDGATEAGSVARWQAAELACGGGRELDPVARTVRHSPSP